MTEAKDTDIGHGLWSYEEAKGFTAEAYKAGIKEVVEWIEENRYKSKYLEGDVMLPVECWQSQKKEWGLDEQSR